MADAVTTDELRTASTDTQNSSNVSSSSKNSATTTTETSRTRTMTVDKSVKTEQSGPSGTSSSTSTKLGPSGQTSNTSAPRGSPPTQMKAAPGNNMATASPKKTDSKGNSPHSKSSADPPAATKSSLQPTSSQQQQLHSSVKASPKKNPWNRNPPTSAPPTGGEGKRGQPDGQSSEQKPTTGGRTASEGSSPLQKDPSRSIKIPGGSEVQLFMLHVLYSVPNCAPHFVCIQIMSYVVSKHVHVRGQVLLHARVSFFFWGEWWVGQVVVHVMLIDTQLFGACKCENVIVNNNEHFLMWPSQG